MCTTYTVVMRLVAGYAVSRGRGVQAGHQAGMQSRWLVTQGSPVPVRVLMLNHRPREMGPGRWVALGLAGPNAPCLARSCGAAGVSSSSTRRPGGPPCRCAAAVPPDAAAALRRPLASCGRAVAGWSSPASGGRCPAASASPVDPESVRPSRSGPSTGDPPWRPARCDRDGGRGEGGWPFYFA
jgi:hypothetical protein